MSTQTTAPTATRPVTRPERDRLAALLRSSLDLEFGWIEVRRTRNGSLRISWSGAPNEEAVAAICAAELADVNIIFSRTRVWSCGNVHTDRAAAWAFHHLWHAYSSEHDAVPVDALDELFAGEAHLARMAAEASIWVSDCSCGHTGFEAVPFSTLEDLVRSSDLSFDDCRDGEFRICLRCGASGQLIDYKTLRLVAATCPACEGRRTFDLSDSTQNKAYLELRARLDAEDS